MPGQRGNLELAQAVAHEADARRVREFLSARPEQAPENTPEVFLVFCGVVALGKSIAAGSRSQLPLLRGYASDSRWRIREAVAMALQYVGDVDMQLLLREMRKWCRGNWHEKRAAAAGLAEPRLLRAPATAAAVLRILDLITTSMVAAGDRHSEPFKTLRQGMGYCWSVVVAAHPDAGKRYIEKWTKSSDPDVRWILKENLKKNRLVRMDSQWVKSCLARLDR
ncbi:MAG: hypothetical protein V1755_01300 [Chloroflexota bacterium]